MGTAVKVLQVLRTIAATFTDEESRKRIKNVLILLCSPFIFIVIVLLMILSMASNHNSSAMDYVFNGGSLPPLMPQEYRRELSDMRRYFTALDAEIAAMQRDLDEGELDAFKIKAVFYSLFFSEKRESFASLERGVISCFIKTEERTRTVVDEDGNEFEESYTVKVTIENMSVIWTNLETFTGKALTEEQKINALAIEKQGRFGGGSPEMNSITEEEWKALVLAGGTISAEGYLSPLGDTWRSMVTSEFGWRSDPFGSGKGEGHGGIDLGAPKGTPIKAAKTGTVCYVRTSLGSSYGYYLIIDHNDGMKTLYAHCSKILVKDGAFVKQGDVIAKVGSTGRSTGNHLHFEVRCDGLKVNPREILP